MTREETRRAQLPRIAAYRGAATMGIGDAVEFTNESCAVAFEKYLKPPAAPKRVTFLRSSEVGYSLRDRRLLGARPARRFATAVLGHLRVRRIDS